MLSSNSNKVMLMPDNQQQHISDTHVQASSAPSMVEHRPKPTVATSSRSRMSIIFGDQCNIQRPSVMSSRRRPTVKKYGIDDFKFVKVLGKGSFGKVLCTCLSLLMVFAKYYVVSAIIAPVYQDTWGSAVICYIPVSIYGILLLNIAMSSFECYFS